VIASSAVVALLQAVALAAPSNPWLTSPDGYRFQFPEGFTGEVASEGGTTVFVGSSPDGLAGAFVRSFPASAASACAEEGAFPFRIRGRPGCSVAQRVGDRETTAFASYAFLELDEGLLVAVAAVGRDLETATRIGVFVLATIERVGPAPGGSRRPARGEDRLLAGCFEHDSLTSQPSISDTSARFFGRVSRVRCFAADRTFSERSVVSVNGPLGSATRDAAREGTWERRGSTVSASYEEGGGADWEVRPHDEGLVIDGNLWRRVDLAAPDAEEADDE
jgi:hypothetical protein